MDLRLRPEGEQGDLAISMNSAREYYEHRARDWELQMLIKARHSAGDAHLTRDFLRSVEEYVYRSPGDFVAVESILLSRERISRKMRESRGQAIDVKRHRGGIRDIEFLVQCLQRLHGLQDHWVRSGGTLFALRKLNDKGWLSNRDYAGLTSAYEFLRKVEHRVQMEAGQWFLLLVHHRLQVAALEHHALSRLHAIEPTVEYARHQNVRRICAGIVDARVAVIAQPHLHLGGIRPANQNTEVRREQRIGIFGARHTRSQAHLHCAAISAISNPGTSSSGALASAASFTVLEAHTRSVPRDGSATSAVAGPAVMLPLPVKYAFPFHACMGPATSSAAPGIALSSGTMATGGVLKVGSLGAAGAVAGVVEGAATGAVCACTAAAANNIAHAPSAHSQLPVRNQPAWNVVASIASRMATC